MQRDMVYFIINGNRDMIKIGRTTDIRARISCLRASRKDDCLCCGCFQNLLHKQAIALETALHHKFKDYRCYGEWFDRNVVEKYIFSLGNKITFPESWCGCTFLFDLKLDKDVSKRFIGVAKTYNAKDVNCSYGGKVFTGVYV